MGKPGKARNVGKKAKRKDDDANGGGRRAGKRNTRSSNKGRLISDATSSTVSLSQLLASMGLYAADTKGDGNCLFRALSDQYYGTPSRHGDVRRDVCSWLETHAERYEGFVDEDEFGGVEAYVKGMREHGTYGGHMELTAFAHMVERDVKVVQPGLVYVIQGGEGETLYVAYHDWEHFSSIRNLRGPHAGLPCVREAPPTKITKIKLKLPPKPEPQDIPLPPSPSPSSSPSSSSSGKRARSPSTPAFSKRPRTTVLSQARLDLDEDLSDMSDCPSEPPISVSPSPSPPPLSRKQQRSAGKIRIPGGRYVPPVRIKVEDEGDEWQLNGTGRMDSRGFRELKI